MEVCRQMLGWLTCSPGGPPSKHPGEDSISPSHTSVNYHQAAFISHKREPALPEWAFLVEGRGHRDK